MNAAHSCGVFFERASWSKYYDCRGLGIFVVGPLLLLGFGKRYVLLVLLAIALEAVGVWLLVRAWNRLGVRVTDDGFVVQGPLGDRLVPFDGVVAIRSYNGMWYRVNRGNYEEPLAGHFRPDDLRTLSIVLERLNVPIEIDER